MTKRCPEKPAGARVGGKARGHGATWTQLDTSTRAREKRDSLTKSQARTALAKAVFLRHFVQCGNVRRSSLAARVGRSTVYLWLEQDEQFKALYDEAHEDAIDLLEEEARRRAVDGVLEPVYQGGKKVGVIRKFSDYLLVQLLKGRRKEVFADRHEVTGKDGGPIGVTPVYVSYDANMKPDDYPTPESLPPDLRRLLPGGSGKP